MRIILEFNGNRQDFEKAFDSTNGSFDIHDSIFYQLDYCLDKEVGIHSTEYGDITIKAED